MEIKFCYKCGKKLIERSQFCPQCGIKLNFEVGQNNTSTKDDDKTNNYVAPNSTSASNYNSAAYANKFQQKSFIPNTGIFQGTPIVGKLDVYNIISLSLTLIFLLSMFLLPFFSLNYINDHNATSQWKNIPINYFGKVLEHNSRVDLDSKINAIPIVFMIFIFAALLTTILLLYINKPYPCIFSSSSVVLLLLIYYFYIFVVWNDYYNDPYFVTSTSVKIGYIFCIICVLGICAVSIVKHVINKKNKINLLIDMLMKYVKNDSIPIYDNTTFIDDLGLTQSDLNNFSVDLQNEIGLNLSGQDLVTINKVGNLIYLLK